MATIPSIVWKISENNHSAYRPASNITKVEFQEGWWSKSKVLD